MFALFLLSYVKGNFPPHISQLTIGYVYVNIAFCVSFVFYYFIELSFIFFQTFSDESWIWWVDNYTIYKL